MVNFFDFGEVRSWFGNQRPEVCAVMAARGSLRVFPFIRRFLAARSDRSPESVVLPLMRAMAPSIVLGEWSTQDSALWNAAADATDAADIATGAINTAVTYDAEYVYAADIATSATYAASAITDDIDTAAYGASRAVLAGLDAADVAAGYAATYAATFDSIAFDATFIESNRTVGELCRIPIWRDGVPEEIELEWTQLRRLLLDLGANWSVWTDWYEDRLLGADDPRSRPLIQGLEVERVRIPDEEWEKGSEYVNALIAEIEAKYRAKVPEQQPASAQFAWGNDGKLHVLPPVSPMARHDAQDARRRAAWVAQQEHLSAFEAVLKAGNFQALNPVLVSYRKALGNCYEDLNVIALGTHGARVESLASRADDILMGVAASELESFAGSHGMFIRQFDEWHDYEADSERAPAQEEVKALLQTAKEIAAATEILAPASSEVLEEAVQSVEVVTIGDSEHDKVPPPAAALKNARRLVGNALSEFFRPILERVRKGSLDGLEEGCKRFVSSAVYRGLGFGLPVLAAHHFGWISYVMKVIEPALKSAGLL